MNAPNVTEAQNHPHRRVAALAFGYFVGVFVISAPLLGLSFSAVVYVLGRLLGYTPDFWYVARFGALVVIGWCVTSRVSALGVLYYETRKLSRQWGAPFNQVLADFLVHDLGKEPRRAKWSPADYEQWHIAKGVASALTSVIMRNFPYRR